MILKNYLNVLFLFAGLISVSQTKVCENRENELIDINTIGKCAIEDFKKSKSKEYIKVATRNRFVRKRNNTHLKNFKKSINAVKTAKKVTADNSISNVNSSIAKKDNTLKDYIRFDQVSDIPVFISCADASNAIKEGCVKETFISNILENFTYPFDAASEGIEGRVWVRFIIDKDGYIKNITTTGPENGTLLEEEAERLVKLLPKFIPGKHNNEYVNVEYFMPIDFQLNE